ncbi:MAG: TonB-dependent receptor plug domain-containing protein, partial [Lentisphaeraceae bacterium]|nr:TonB-dependent receptor plug domain-containing protein [Lentisphaeraceae bacterium]
MNLTLLRKIALTASVFAALTASAKETDKAAAKAKTEVTTEADKDRYLVLGSIIPENGNVLIGSSARLELDDIRTQSYADVNRVLKKIPGINTREEDGYGIFNSISMRGVDSHRSLKITLLEDGIMSAPAPYSAPDAYYSPNAARMSGIEVIKGSSSIKFGPHSVGGVINYLSTPIPTEETFYYKQLFGNYGEARSHAYYGNSYDLDAGTLSFLLEYYDRQNDGFHDIQHVGGDTGIDTQQEPMLKIRFEPKTDMYQFFELKLAHTEFSGPLSYTGVHEDDFNDNPYDRYWGTQWD